MKAGSALSICLSPEGWQFCMGQQHCGCCQCAMGRAGEAPGDSLPHTHLQRGGTAVIAPFSLQPSPHLNRCLG